MIAGASVFFTSAVNAGGFLSSASPYAYSEHSREAVTRGSFGFALRPFSEAQGGLRSGRVQDRSELAAGWATAPPTVIRRRSSSKSDSDLCHYRDVVTHFPRHVVVNHLTGHNSVRKISAYEEVIILKGMNLTWTKDCLNLL